jgi:NAD(P)-dependent dehydrogenase (short-subunit alcohol dehydrogenase family)
MKKGIALVTGGSKGIGRALCLRLKDAGYQVFSASRSKSLPQGMDEITQISVDFSNSEETRSFAEKFLADNGVPVVLVNNAGYGAFYEWADFPKEEINRQIQVLFSSPVELCRIFAPAMAEQSRGVIVNLSSLATLYPLPFMPLLFPPFLKPLCWSTTIHPQSSTFGWEMFVPTLIVPPASRAIIRKR